MVQALFKYFITMGRVVFSNVVMVLSALMSAIVFSVGGDIMDFWSLESAIICAASALREPRAVFATLV